MFTRTVQSGGGGESEIQEAEVLKVIVNTSTPYTLTKDYKSLTIYFASTTSVHQYIRIGNRESDMHTIASGYNCATWKNVKASDNITTSYAEWILICFGVN